MPVSSVTPGMTGEGWTVSQGTTPEPFDGEVLGVLPDAIAPGRDMIIVEATSPAIDAAGGIWAGMSGSPFYVDDKLVGVVAFGLTLGPSPIAGLTPAEEIRRVHQYPISSLASAPAKVTLPRALARKVARRAALRTSQASTFVRLKVPVSVSGVPARSFKRLNAMARRTGAKILGYNGASASSVLPGDPSEIVPGGNFAAALSYGDVTIAGVGTTSYVCDERAVAFGHPFFFTGATSAAASVADALTIVTGDLFGPFKLATVGGPVGILDQDRLGGVRTLLGLTPGTTPIQSGFTSLDTGRARAGQTDAVVDDFLADLTFFHTLGNIDSVLDAIGKGSARLEWTITGSDDDGDPWSLARQDILASEWDISFDASVQLADEVFAIGQFQDEGVTVDGIEMSGDAEQTLKLLRIKKVLVKRAGEFVRLGSEITARPGQLVKFEVVLRSIPGAPDRLVHLRVRMPDNFRHAVIEIAGGPTEEFCEDEFCEGPETFAELLDDLRTKRQHNDLAATVFGGRNFVARDVDTRRFDRAVQGQRTVFVSRAGGGGEAPAAGRAG